MASGLLEQVPGAKREKVQHQRHDIDVVATPALSLRHPASPWFSPPPSGRLDALLDRADHRVNNPDATLDSDAAIGSCLAPAIQLCGVLLSTAKDVFERLAACELPSLESGSGEATMLEKCDALRFDAF